MKSRKSLRLFAAASSALLLANCSQSRLAELPAPLQVDQPTTCEEILAPVAVPMDRPEDDAISAYLENRKAAIVASAEIELGRKCIERQRRDYAGKGGS